MKRKPLNERGAAFILVMIVIMVTGIWIVSLGTLTKASATMETRRQTLNETLYTADATLERAWSHWSSLVADSSTLPTTEEIQAGWEDDEKVFANLNKGVIVDPAKVTLRQIDYVGRIMEEDKQAPPGTKMDTSRGLPKTAYSFVASVTAEGVDPGGTAKGSTTPVSVTVNRVFQKSYIPLFQFLGFYDHTLFLHNGPVMDLNGKLHSNQRIFSLPSNKVNINAAVSGPPSLPVVQQDGYARRSHDAIRNEIKQMIADGRHSEIKGFFWGKMLDYEITGVNHDNSDNKTGIQGLLGSHADAYKYTPSGTLYLFDPNDSEFQQYWGDTNGDGINDNAWKTSSNPNINSGYRELIERPNANADDTLFIASKRFYNQANIKIEYDSSVSGFLKANGTIDPSKIKIYYKDLTVPIPKVLPLPPNPTSAQLAAHNAAKEAAIEAHTFKREVPVDLKEEILTALSWKADKFRDQWMQDDAPNGSSKDFDGKMDILDINMGVLKSVLDAWVADGYQPLSEGSDIMVTPPIPSEMLENHPGMILYVTDTAANPDTGVGRSKGVRLQNGSRVPVGGLTVATDLLAYVHGNYNTANTADYKRADHPSALIADNIRLLSKSWDDSKSFSGNASGNRIASETTFNLAMVMGDRQNNAMETNSGGLHNFPRFLEVWGDNVKCNINGAFIQLWDSKYMLKEYPSNHSNYYSPPRRVFGFENSFLFRPPPGSLEAVEYSRGRYWISNS